MGFKINEAELADFGIYMGAEGSLTLPLIEKLACEEGLSADGFKGLLKPLGDICTGPAATQVSEAFDLMQKALCNLGDGLVATAKQYGYVDEDNRSVFERTENWWRKDYKRYLPESHKGR